MRFRQYVDLELLLVQRIQFTEDTKIIFGEKLKREKLNTTENDSANRERRPKNVDEQVLSQVDQAHIHISQNCVATQLCRDEIIINNYM